MSRSLEALSPIPRTRQSRDQPPVPKSPTSTAASVDPPQGARSIDHPSCEDKLLAFETWAETCVGSPPGQDGAYTRMGGFHQRQPGRNQFFLSPSSSGTWGCPGPSLGGTSSSLGRPCKRFFRSRKGRFDIRASCNPQRTKPSTLLHAAVLLGYRD